MIVEDLDAMYEETYKKNEEIQSLLVEVKDYNEILVYLYQTEIQRPNLTLNAMIDKYEEYILSLRELHNNMIQSLNDFGQVDQLAASISENENLAEKVKDLMLWKLRRIFMIYDQEPVLPYVEGSLVGITLIESSSDTESNPGNPEDVETAEEVETNGLNPEGDIFPEPDDEKTPTGNPE